MTNKPFGAEEINLVGDSGTPTVEGSANIAIKLGNSSSAATTKLYIGDATNIATGEIANPANTTVVNCGILTAHKVYAANFSGTGGGGGSGGGPRYDDGLVLTEDTYLSWKSDAVSPVNRVRMTGKADDTFIIENDALNDETLRITPGGNLSIHNSSPSEPHSSVKTIQIDNGAIIEGKNINSYVSIGANCTRSTNNVPDENVNNYIFSNSGGFATQLKIESGNLIYRMSSSNGGTAGSLVQWLPRLSTTVMGASTVSSADINPFSGTTVNGTTLAYFSDEATGYSYSSNYHLTLRRPTNTQAAACGLAFSSDGADTIGASIVHQRIDGSNTNSSGNLMFFTRKQPNQFLRRRMTITNSGDVGIGTYDPLGAGALATNTSTLTVGTLKANTLIGTFSGGDLGATQFNGNVTVGDGSNSYYILAYGAIASYSDIIAYYTSDKKFKDDIKPISNALEKVLSISGNTFTWNDKAPKPILDIVGKKDIGVIAQEIEALGLPGVINTKDDGTKGVRYEKLAPLLIEAIKELEARVTLLEK